MSSSFAALDSVGGLVRGCKAFVDAHFDRTLSSLEMDGEAGTFTFADGLEAINRVVCVLVGPLRWLLRIFVADVERRMRCTLCMGSEHLSTRA